MIILTLLFCAVSFQAHEAENLSLKVQEVLLESTASERIMLTAVVSDGSSFAKGSKAGEVLVAAIPSGTIKYQAQFPGDDTPWLGTVYEKWVYGHANRITGLVFSPNGDALYCSNGDGMLRKINLVLGSIDYAFQVGYPLSRIAINSDGAKLLLGSSRGSIKEYDISGSGQPVLLRTIRGEDGSGPVHGLKYIASGSKIFSSIRGYHLSDDQENGDPQPGDFLNAGPTIWNASTGLREIRFAGPEGTSEAVLGNMGSNYFFGTVDRGSAVYENTGALVDTRVFNGGERISRITADGEGGEVIVTATGRAVVFVDPANEHEELMSYLSRDMSPGAMSCAVNSNIVVVGLSNGGAVVLKVDSLAGGVRAIPDSTVLGQLGGLNITATQKLLGHNTSIDEVCVAASENVVATRDSDGKAVLWRRSGSGLFSGEQLAVDLEDVWGNQNVFSFSPTETHLLVVNADGNIESYDLSATPATATTLSITNGGVALDVISALLISATEIVVGDRDSGLFVANTTTGVVSTTIVASLPETDHTTPPFTVLMNSPNSQQFLAAPTSVSRQAPSTHTATIFSKSSFAKLHSLVGRYVAAQFACVGPSTFVIADGGSGTGVAFLNSMTLAAEAGKPVRSRDGIGCYQPGYALGFDHGGMAAVWLNGNSIQTQSWTLPWGSAVNAVGSPLSGGIIVVGLESGALIVVEGV